MSQGCHTTINAAAFSKLQILLPGETASPGSASGKTGTPSAQTAGSSFNATVNAVDANWNPVTSTDTVAITSSDANASLPANAALIAGTKTWALAWTEKGSRFDLANVVTTARREGREYVLNGEKTAVIGAPWADHLIVSARTSGHRHDRGGVSLFVVDRRAANLDLQSFKTIDGRRAAEISLRDVRAQLLGHEGEGVVALEACRDRAVGALCAETVGAMAELNAATLEYAKTRKQFGTTIGSFQVLQHRMVDMFIAHQEALSLMQHLSLSLVANEAGLSRLASGAKSKIGYAGRFIADQAVQLHGGMGMSDELNVGHYFKRISSINIQFGDPAFHVLRFAQLDTAA